MFPSLFHQRMVFHSNRQCSPLHSLWPLCVVERENPHCVYSLLFCTEDGASQYETAHSMCSLVASLWSKLRSNDQPKQSKESTHPSKGIKIGDAAMPDPKVLAKSTRANIHCTHVDMRKHMQYEDKTSVSYKRDALSACTRTRASAERTQGINVSHANTPMHM